MKRRKFCSVEPHSATPKVQTRVGVYLKFGMWLYGAEFFKFEQEYLTILSRMNKKLNLIKHSAFHIEIYRNKPKRVILTCLCVCVSRFRLGGEAVLSNQSFVPFVLICLLSCKLLRTITGSTRFQFPSHEPSKKKFQPYLILEVVLL